MTMQSDLSEVSAAIETLIENEVARRIKEYSIFVRIDGKLVDSSAVIEGGQIDINLETPFYFPHE